MKNSERRYTVGYEPTQTSARMRMHSGSIPCRVQDHENSRKTWSMHCSIEVQSVQVGLSQQTEWYLSCNATRGSRRLCKRSESAWSKPLCAFCVVLWFNAFLFACSSFRALSEKRVGLASMVSGACERRRLIACRRSNGVTTVKISGMSIRRLCRVDWNVRVHWNVTPNPNPKPMDLNQKSILSAAARDACRSRRRTWGTSASSAKRPSARASLSMS